MTWQWIKMQFYKERILNAAQLKRLSEHKYSCTSASLLDAWLQPWWCWLVSKTPLWLAPNLITILGLIINIVTTLLLVWWVPKSKVILTFKNLCQLLSDRNGFHFLHIILLVLSLTYFFISKASIKHPRSVDCLQCLFFFWSISLSFGAIGRYNCATPIDKIISRYFWLAIHRIFKFLPRKSV